VAFAPRAWISADLRSAPVEFPRARSAELLPGPGTSRRATSARWSIPCPPSRNSRAQTSSPSRGASPAFGSVRHRAFDHAAGRVDRRRGRGPRCRGRIGPSGRTTGRRRGASIPSHASPTWAELDARRSETTGDAEIAVDPWSQTPASWITRRTVRRGRCGRSRRSPGGPSWLAAIAS
jgi:hypothetical protein